MKISFNSENKSKSDFDFPKLYLEMNERARIVVIEPEPTVNFVHTLRAPSIINGQVEMETVKDKSGAISERPKMQFIGKHLCFGDPNALMEKGKDPQNCPTCEAAQQDDSIGGAQRRFAVHVVQYKVQPGGFKPQTPFNAELVVWAFPDRTFSSLVDIMEEHGDLRNKDLLLGPCSSKTYQNFDIQVGGSAAWRESEANQQFVAQLYQQNKLDDLNPIIGRKVTREQAMEDIQKVRIRNAQAFGGAANDAAPALGGSTGLDLSKLLDDSPKETMPDWAAAPAAAPVAEDPWTGAPAAAETAPVPAEVPAAAEAAPAPAAPAPTLDFDSLLSGLD